MHYWCSFLGGDTEGNFGMSAAGVLQVKKDLDREEIPVYSIIVKASSNRNWSPRRGQRSQRAQVLDPSRDPTLQEVRIFLEDINDQSPRFTKMEYTAGNRFIWFIFISAFEPCFKVNSGASFTLPLILFIYLVFKAIYSSTIISSKLSFSSACKL